MPGKGRPFEKGHAPMGGRPKGAKSRITVLREGVMEALNAEGGVEYLRTLAKTEPKAFSTLLAKVLPTQLDVERGGALEEALKRTSDADLDTRIAQLLSQAGIGTSA